MYVCIAITNLIVIVIITVPVIPSWRRRPSSSLLSIVQHHGAAARDTASQFSVCSYSGGPKRFMYVLGRPRTPTLSQSSSSLAKLNRVVARMVAVHARAQAMALHLLVGDMYSPSLPRPSLVPCSWL